MFASEVGGFVDYKDMGRNDYGSSFMQIAVGDHSVVAIMAILACVWL